MSYSNDSKDTGALGRQATGEVTPPQEAAANRLSPEASIVAGVILAYDTRCSDCQYPRHQRFDLRRPFDWLARKYCHFSNFRRFGISQENSIKHISHPPLDL